MLFSKVCRLVSESFGELSYLAQGWPVTSCCALAAQTSHSPSIRIGINMGKRGTR